MKQSPNRRYSFGSALVLAFAVAAAPYGACADSGSDRHDRDDYRKDGPHANHYVIRRDHPIAVPAKRIRRYRDVVILRPYGHWYPGYGHYHTDNDAASTLAQRPVVGIFDTADDGFEQLVQFREADRAENPVKELGRHFH